MVKIKDFEQKQGKIDISIPTIMSEEQHGSLKKQLDDDVKKAIKKYNPPKKYKKRKKYKKHKIKKIISSESIVPIQEKEKVEHDVFQAPSNPVPSPDSVAVQDSVICQIANPVLLPKENQDIEEIKNHLISNNSQVQDSVSSNSLLASSGLDTLKLLKQEIKTKKRLLKLQRKQEKLKRKQEKKFVNPDVSVSEIPKESRSLMLPTFDEERADMNIEDISLASTNVTKIKFCTSCGKKLKKDWVRRDGNVLIQGFSCKKCKLTDEVRFSI